MIGQRAKVFTPEETQRAKTIYLRLTYPSNYANWSDANLLALYNKVGPFSGVTRVLNTDFNAWLSGQGLNYYYSDLKRAIDQEDAKIAARSAQEKLALVNRAVDDLMLQFLPGYVGKMRDETREGWFVQFSDGAEALGFIDIYDCYDKDRSKFEFIVKTLSASSEALNAAVAYRNQLTKEQAQRNRKRLTDALSVVAGIAAIAVLPALTSSAPSVSSVSSALSIASPEAGKIISKIDVIANAPEKIEKVIATNPVELVQQKIQESIKQVEQKVETAPVIIQQKIEAAPQVIEKKVEAEVQRVESTPPPVVAATVQEKISELVNQSKPEPVLPVTIKPPITTIEPAQPLPVKAPEMPSGRMEEAGSGGLIVLAVVIGLMLFSGAVKVSES